MHKLNKHFAKYAKTRKLKHRQAAEGFYNEAVELEPDRMEPHFSLADWYMSVGDYEKAIPLFARAVAIDSNSTYIYARMGLAFHGIKEERPLTDSEMDLCINFARIVRRKGMERIVHCLGDPWELCDCYR